MTLNYVTVSANMDSAYDALKNDKIQDNPNQVPYPRAPLTQWMDAFKTNYDNDANNGTFSEANVVMTPMPALLEFDNTGSTCSGPNMMAAKIAQYWAAQVTPGTPQHKTSITNVVNDAAKIEAPIQAYLCGSTSVLSTPHYEHLFLFIENQVKTIIWQVTEADGGGSATYPVTIS